MHGSRRVITFCLLTTVLPSILIVLPLYLRNIRYADVMYKISDSDVIQIHKGQSSIFCEKHHLKMNSTFNAFQMKGTPELSDKRKHIRLKKSMALPDDTLEYWGFYLFKGASIELKACSRYEDSKILVVKGEKILNTCGILDENTNRKNPPLIDNQHVLVTLENPTKSVTKHPKALESNENNKEYLDDLDAIKYVHHNQNRNENDLKNTNNNLKTSVIPYLNKLRKKRDKSLPIHNPNTVLDTGVNHGGNALNTTKESNENSASSFETSLHECYHNNIIYLPNDYIPYSIQCNNTEYLENTTILKIVHNVLEDGYYYYIFYSDNDFVKNDIHAIFDIYKPTFQYANISEAKFCVNKTECEFDVGFLSGELVIVEMPTKEGLKNDESDNFILISVCKPRVSVYVIFPISVLLLILLFAFL